MNNYNFDFVQDFCNVMMALISEEKFCKMVEENDQTSNLLTKSLLSAIGFDEGDTESYSEEKIDEMKEFLHKVKSYYLLGAIEAGIDMSILDKFSIEENNNKDSEQIEEDLNDEEDEDIEEQVEDEIEDEPLSETKLSAFSSRDEIVLLTQQQLQNIDSICKRCQPDSAIEEPLSETKLSASSSREECIIYPKEDDNKLSDCWFSYSDL